MSNKIISDRSLPYDSNSSNYPQVESGSKNKTKTLIKPKSKLYLRDFYSLATPFDIILMILGFFGSFSVGVAQPIFNLVLGKFLDKLNEPGANFQNAINELCLIFVYIGIAIIFFGYLVRI